MSRRENRNCGILRGLMANLSVYSLVVTSIPFATFAAEKKSDGRNAWVGDAMQVINTGMNIYSQANAINQQGNMAMMSAQKFTQSRIKLEPARYFPNCPVPQDKSDTPVGMCEDISNPQEMAEALSWRNLAEQNVADLDKFQGQCLDDNQKALMAKMQDKVNAIQKYMNEVNKQQQAFRAENKKILDDMESINGELNGNSQDLDAQSKTLAATFGDPACLSVLKSEVLSGKGLRNVKKYMEGKLVSQAGSTLADKTTIEGHLNTQIQRIKDQINLHGLQTWIQADPKMAASSTSRGLSQFGPIGSVIAERNQIIGVKFQKAKDKLRADIGYNLPDMDAQFDSEVAKLGDAKATEDIFRKKYVNDCVTMKGSIGGSDGLGLSPDQLIKSLTYNGGSSTHGTNLQSYKVELRRVLDSDLPLTDKLNAIKKLDTKYEGVGINLNRPYADQPSNYIFTPHGLLSSVALNCEKKFAQAKTSGGDSADSRSFNEKVQSAIKSIAELKQLKSSYVGDLSTSVANEVLNCPSAGAPKQGSCGTAERYDTTSADYCLRSATTCASNVNACFNKATGIIKEKEDQMKVKAVNYNKNVSALIAGQEAMLKNITGQVLADAEFFKQYFVGSKWKMPENLFVEMPKGSKENPFGLELLGNGRIDEFLNGEGSLASQLAKLKTVLEGQSKEVDDTVRQYAEKKKALAEADKAKWQKLSSKCASASASFKRQALAEQKRAMEDFNKQQAQMKQACMKAKNLSALPSCNKNSIRSLSKDIAQIEAPGMQNLVYESEVACGMDDEDGESTAGMSISDKLLAASIASKIDKKSADSEKLPESAAIEVFLASRCQSPNTKVSEIGNEIIKENLPALLRTLNQSSDLDERVEFEESDLEGWATLDNEKKAKIMKAFKQAGRNGRSAIIILANADRLKDEKSTTCADLKQAKGKSPSITLTDCKEKTGEALNTCNDENSKKNQVKDTYDKNRDLLLSLAQVENLAEGVEQRYAYSKIGENATLPECNAFNGNTRNSPLDLFNSAAFSSSPFGQGMQDGKSLGR